MVWMRWRWWVAGGALILAVALAVALWPSGDEKGLPLPPARARMYTAFDACLLTDTHGLATAQTAAVWDGMQNASLATHAKVSYLAVTGPDTPANASVFINTLLVRHCDLVLAVGASEVRAALAAAASYPEQHFVVVGGGPAAGNVAVVPSSAGLEVPARVAAVVRAATAGSFSGGGVSSGS